jgi:hypothetical protein
MIKAGASIRCCMCKKIIFVAAEDIPHGAPMASRLLRKPDGEVVKKNAVKSCPECWIMFRSISTETAETII